MTVQEARKILGKDYSEMSDKDIESIVAMVYNLSKGTVRSVIKLKHEESN